MCLSFQFIRQSRVNFAHYQVILRKRSQEKLASQPDNHYITNALKQEANLLVMDVGLKNELIDYVLSRTPIKAFNKAIKEYSVQALYSRYKRELMNDYPELMPTDLRYSIAMSNAFDEFKVDEIACKEMDKKMSKKRKMAVSRSIPVARKRKHKEEYNKMVEKFNKMIKPQNELIKRYKDTRRN